MGQAEVTAEEREGLQARARNAVDNYRSKELAALDARCERARQAIEDELAKHGHRNAAYCQHRIVSAITEALGGGAD